MKKHQPWNHQPFFLWLTCTTNQTLAVGCGAFIQFHRFFCGTRKSTQMLGTGLLLCRFPVVSWHVTAPKVHLDSGLNVTLKNGTKQCNKNRMKNGAIVTHRETERNTYRLHRALISCSESIQWSIKGWGWWFVVTCPFRIFISLNNYFAAACSIVQNTLPSLLLDAGKKKLFKSWNIFVFFCHITALLQLICSWLSVIHWISKR